MEGRRGERGGRGERRYLVPTTYSTNTEPTLLLHPPAVRTKIFCWHFLFLSFLFPPPLSRYCHYAVGAGVLPTSANPVSQSVSVRTSTSHTGRHPADYQAPSSLPVPTHRVAASLSVLRCAAPRDEDVEICCRRPINPLHCLPSFSPDSHGDDKSPWRSDAAIEHPPRHGLLAHSTSNQHTCVFLFTSSTCPPPPMTKLGDPF
ncbi:hypothetical protein LY76DRAFT_241527 [Colletotrichum caudatum]|nr:hypothetical protein LY76DRAFT_241527 [Colletotrichum caudatum]